MLPIWGGKRDTQVKVQAFWLLRKIFNTTSSTSRILHILFLWIILYFSQVLYLGKIKQRKWLAITESEFKSVTGLYIIPVWGFILGSGVLVILNSLSLYGLWTFKVNVVFSQHQLLKPRKTCSAKQIFILCVSSLYCSLLLTYHHSEYSAYFEFLTNNWSVQFTFVKQDV